MRKVEIFRESWVHKLENNINEWAKKGKHRIISASVTQCGNGEFMSMVTYEDDQEKALLS